MRWIIGRDEAITDQKTTGPMLWGRKQGQNRRDGEESLSLGGYLFLSVRVFQTLHGRDDPISSIDFFSGFRISGM